MQTFNKQTFSDIYDRDSSRALEDMEFVRCVFQNCTFSMARKPDTRSRASKVTLRNCTTENCLVFSPVLRQVVIDTLRSGTAPLFTWGALFDQVTITGKIDSIVVTQNADSPLFPDADRAAFNKARKEFYANVDWALDISGAQARELEIYGVPSHLIRRDPTTQAVVRREQALDEERWQQLDLRGTWWKPAIKKLLLHDYDEVVLAAPLRHPRANLFIEGIQLLRSVGVADSD